jgi:hypothetical protein
MTEDILFDNIYIGHSVEDAKAFAAESFDIKKPLESAAAKASDPLDDDEDLHQVSFKDDPIAFFRQKFSSLAADPVDFIRQKIFTFIDLAKIDPVLAFKTHPETGVGLVGVLLTFFGMLGALFGVVGASQTPITKVN